MRISGTALRQIIREVILNDGFRLTNAPRQPMGAGEPAAWFDNPDDPPAAQLAFRGAVKTAASLKSKFREHPGMRSWIKIHWEEPMSLITELTRWNPNLEKSVALYRDREAASGAKSSSVSAWTTGILLRGGRLTGVYDEDPWTEYHKLDRSGDPAKNWRYYPGQVDRYFGRPIPTEAEGPLWVARGMKAANSEDPDASWTMQPEDAPEGELYEGTLVGGVPEAIVIRRVPSYLTPAETEQVVGHLEALDMPILDRNLMPISLQTAAQIIKSR